MQTTVDADGIVLLTINNPRVQLNVLNLEELAELEKALEEIGALTNPVPAGLVIVSGKVDNFMAGIDITEFAGFATAEEAAAGSRQVQQLFGIPARLPFPSVAAINGACVGGGLELALNCTSRIITTHPKSALGLPEVRLGILPGGSGSQRLPRLIGPSAALEMMLTGKQVYPRRALHLGLVDEIVSPGVLVKAARQRILTGKVSERPGRRRSWGTRMLDGPLRGLVYRKARHLAVAKSGGNYPAPLKIIDVVRQGYGRKLEAGLASEAAAIGELMVSPVSRALIHIFFAGRVSREEGPTVPAEVSRLGVLGGGLMGTGIAKVALERGIPVRHKDVSLDALIPALEATRQYLMGKAAKGIIAVRDAAALHSRYAPTDDMSGFRHSSIAIEAVIEDLDLKRRIIADLEEVMPGKAVIATNTSSLSIADIARDARHPERIIGMHFFSPVEKMPLLEVIPSGKTDAETVATAAKFGQRLGKTVIIVKDSPGFFVNRILAPYLGEAFKLLADGVRITDLDRQAVAMGFPVGPCTLIDEAGIDVLEKVLDVLQPHMGERLELEDIPSRLVADNRMGRKNGRGFYRYRNGKRVGEDADVYRLLDQGTSRNIRQDEVHDRLLYGLLNEASLALEEGVIAEPGTGDIGAVYGIGYPPFLGGPYWTIDKLGADRVVATLRELAGRHGSRFEPASALQRMADDGRLYYPKSGS